MAHQSIDAVKYLLSETDPSRLPASTGEVAFVGRSNVGKSTLLNGICRKDLAKVSATPGRTRTINIFLAGRNRWLVDLPGYGFAQGRPEELETWQGMIEGYLRRPTLRMIFALVDAKTGPSALDRQMLKWLEAEKLPWHAVATKTDLIKTSQVDAQRQSIAHGLGLQPEQLAWVSSETGKGLGLLRSEISSLLGPDA